MTETLRFTGVDGQGNQTVQHLTIAIATEESPTYDLFVPNSAGGAGLLSAIASSTSNQRIGVEAGPNLFRVAGPGAFKAGLEFVAVGGRPRITGAATLTTWTKDGSANRWYQAWTFQARDNIIRNTGGRGDTVCEIYADGSNSCFDRDRVYIDSLRATQVFSIAAGDAATGNRFYLDRTARRVYIWTNPSGRTVEITKTAAFVNDTAVNGVKFTGFQFERFASPLQRSGINVSGDYWEFDDCDFAHMNSGGMHWTNTTNTYVHDSRFWENGQAGLTSGSTTVRSGVTRSNNLIERCVFTRSNVESRTYIGDWEASDVKTTDDAGLTARDNIMDGCRGVSLWTDYGANCVFEGNTINNAFGQAIRSEVARNMIIRNNTIKGSGYNIGGHYRATHTNWSTCMDTAAIAISESQYVECYGNEVDWDLPAGEQASLNGIVVNVRGRQDTHHIFAHDNKVQMRSTPVPTGAAGTGTKGTMIAGGVLMSGANQTAAQIFGVAETWTMPGGSGIAASQRVQVKDNEYRHGDSSTFRFVYRNGATGTGTNYFTPAQYAALNPQDAADLAT